METTQSPGPSVLGEIGDTVKSTVDEAKQEGQRIAEAARANALRAAEERKSMAADFVKDVSSAIHKGSEELRSRGRAQSAEIVERAAGEIDRICDSLSDRGVEDLWGEMENFARRRPALFFGAALLAGFGAIRFAMSSQRHPADEDERPIAGHDPYRPEAGR